MTNLVDASKTNSLVTGPESSRRNSRPISGDTLGGFRRKDSAAGIQGRRGDSNAGMGLDDITATPGSGEGPKTKARRESSSLSPLGMQTQTAGPSNRSIHEDNDLVSGKVPGESYDAGPDAEDGRQAE